jgi:hypothetical protein
MLRVHFWAVALVLVALALSQEQAEPQEQPGAAKPQTAGEKARPAAPENSIAPPPGATYTTDNSGQPIVTFNPLKLADGRQLDFKMYATQVTAEYYAKPEPRGPIVDHAWRVVTIVVLHLTVSDRGQQRTVWTDVVSLPRKVELPQWRWIVGVNGSRGALVAIEPSQCAQVVLRRRLSAFGGHRVYSVELPEMLHFWVFDLSKEVEPSLGAKAVWRIAAESEWDSNIRFVPTRLKGYNRNEGETINLTKLLQKGELWVDSTGQSFSGGPDTESELRLDPEWDTHAVHRVGTGIPRDNLRLDWDPKANSWRLNVAEKYFLTRVSHEKWLAKPIER